MTGPHVEDEAYALAPRRNGKRAGTVLEWTPPLGMTTEVTRAWRSFYGAAQREYGITPQQYRDLYIAQHGCCFICRTAKGKHPDDPNGRGGRRLGVDHNHVTGAVRGLLCTGGDKTCNRVIGWLALAALQRAVSYVQQEPAQAVLAAGARMRAEGRNPRELDGTMRVILGLS